MCWVGNSGSWHVWGKTGRRRCFGYLGGGELEIIDLGSGIRVQSSVYPYFMVFRASGLGFYLRLEDMSSPRSETEWINLSIGPSYTPPQRVWG
jgi:hypothetical protein